MQHLLKMTLGKLQHVGGKAKSNMVDFGLFGRSLSFEGGGDRRSVVLVCFGNWFGFFYHSISLHYREIKDNT